MLVKILIRINFLFILAEEFGGLAQLARAFGWQPKGHRFESDILHKKAEEIFFGFFYFYVLLHFINPQFGIEQISISK